MVSKERGYDPGRDYDVQCVDVDYGRDVDCGKVTVEFSLVILANGYNTGWRGRRHDRGSRQNKTGEGRFWCSRTRKPPSRQSRKQTKQGRRDPVTYRGPLIRWRGSKEGGGRGQDRMGKSSHGHPRE